MNLFKITILTLFFSTLTLDCMEERPQNQSLKRKHAEEEQQVTSKEQKFLSKILERFGIF